MTAPHHRTLTERADQTDWTDAERGQFTHLVLDAWESPPARLLLLAAAAAVLARTSHRSNLNRDGRELVELAVLLREEVDAWEARRALNRALDSIHGY